MNPALTKDQLQRILPLLDEALDCTPSQRAAWFDADARVAALDENARAALKRMIVDAAETVDPLVELPSLESRESSGVNYVTGDQIGPYQLVAPLGRGGMAEVWRASRSDGAYRREVALKLPLAVSGAARAHFERRSKRERDVLATLEHPHIARFYDAGIATTRLGEQAYLALELIEGEPIDVYAKRMQLPLAARCGLMQQVLSAVQYAHERLIVHRDLKPSNILVRGDGRVALLDFGIAKFLGAESDANEDAALTREMGAAVTPAYAAPEQLQGDAISTATDVFSAGVVLFELLTGVRPFATSREGGAPNLGRILDVMRHGEAPTLATAFSNARSDVEDDAARGSETSRSVTLKTLRGDVSAIVAKALRIQPNERYATAQAFHDDLAAFLSDRPVSARDGARWYYAKKFLLRHRVPMLVGALGVTAVTIASVIAITQRATAQANTAQAAAVQSLLDSLFAGMSPDLAETRTYTTKELLDRARASLPSSPKTENDFALGLRFAELYRSIGENSAAESLYASFAEQARRVGRNDDAVRLQIQHALAKFDQGEIDAGTQLLSPAVEYLRGARGVSEHTKMLGDYAEGLRLFHLGSIDKSNALFANVESRDVSPSTENTALKALATQMRANVLLWSRRYDEARMLFQRAISAYASMGAQYESAKLQTTLQQAQMELERANYRTALIDLNSVKKEIDARFAPTHAVRLLGDYVQAASELFSGQLVNAKESVERYAIAAVSVPAHQQSAVRLLAAERMYRGETKAALAILEPHVIQPRRADDAFSIHNALNRRLRAEILLRANRDEEAYAELASLVEYIASREAAPDARRALAYTRFTLAVAKLRRDEFRDAAALLEMAAPTIEKEFAAADITAQAFLGYRALTNKILGREAESESFRKSIRKDVWPVWQEGASEFLDAINSPAERKIAVPVVM